LPRRRATYRVKDRRPVFHCACEAGDVRLIRLRPGSDRDDRNLSVRVATEGLAIRVSISEEQTVDLVVGEPGPALRLTPRLSLEPGEYAFVSQSNPNTLNARMYDFGVD
jgi:hypothetical protein